MVIFSFSIIILLYSILRYIICNSFHFKTLGYILNDLFLDNSSKSLIDKSIKNILLRLTIFTDDVSIIIWWCFILIMCIPIFYCCQRRMCSLSLHLNDLYWYRPQVAYFIFYYRGGSTNNSRNDVNNEEQINFVSWAAEQK